MDELQGQRDIAEAREKAGSEIVNISKQKQAAEMLF